MHIVLMTYRPVVDCLMADDPSHSHSHDHAGHSHSHAAPGGYAGHGSADSKYRPTENDMEKLRSTIKQFVRDWSEEVDTRNAEFCMRADSNFVCRARRSVISATSP